MYRNNPQLEEQAYSPDHIEQVLTDMYEQLSSYMSSLGADCEQLRGRFAKHLADFQREQEQYQALLDATMLAEYSYDPNAFKGDLRRKCPIIRRCLMSPAKIMDTYRAAFTQTDGAKMLEVSANIVQFAQRFMQGFSDEAHLQAQSPKELGVSELDEEPYTVYGVIGGGIRSHFVHHLYPQAFPNRSQNAIWAYYFLTQGKEYGLAGGSEFLMIEEEGAQQNFFYPYDLFGFYALKLFLVLQDHYAAIGCPVDSAYRYVYLDALLDHIADRHREDINYLRPQYEQLYY